MICISIAESSFQIIEKRLNVFVPHADMVEIRLDALSQSASPALISSMISHTRLPIIFTCRRQDEGGAFPGDEAQRLECLWHAVDAGAAFIDVELRSDEIMRDRLIQHAESSGCKVIISWHDFHETPSDTELRAVLEQQKQAGAHIAKVVTMAREQSDILRLFSIYYAAAELAMPLIAFCMGKAGKISRVACLAMGSYLSFASPDTGLETAPGQIPLKQFRYILDNLL